MSLSTDPEEDHDRELVEAVNPEKEGVDRDGNASWVDASDSLSDNGADPEETADSVGPLNGLEYFTVELSEEGEIEPAARPEGETECVATGQQPREVLDDCTQVDVSVALHAGPQVHMCLMELLGAHVQEAHDLEAGTLNNMSPQ
jgi:hypothetical protein